MIEKLLENWLDSASERSYQAVFVQMLAAKGYRVVHSTRHTALEYGKDILAIDQFGKGCAYQLKGNPGGKLGLSQFREEIQPQLVQLMSQKIVFPGFPNEPYNLFLVSNGYFEEEVHRAIDDLNRMACYHSKVSLISRGDLLTCCKEYGTLLWPSELKDSRTLLELYLSDKNDLIPEKKLSELITKILAIESIQSRFSSKAEYYRAITSAALLTGIATSGFAEAENHFAVISAWTLFTVSIIAAGKKHRFKLDGSALNTLKLAEISIIDALSQLWKEVNGRKHLVEGSAFSDSEVYKWRYTTMLGLLSCLAIWDEKNTCLTEDTRNNLRRWLAQQHKDIELWGEAAVASLVPWLIWLRKNDSTIQPDLEIAGLVKAVIKRKLNKKVLPLANPYYSYENIFRSRFKVNNKEPDLDIKQDTFVGTSFITEPLFHLLVRTNLKRTCKELWPDFTRISHSVCMPDNIWEYCTLRIKHGANETKIYPSTYQWGDLKSEALNKNNVLIPEELAKRPWLLALWWQVAPYRYTTAASRIFAEGVFPGWGWGL